MFRESIWKKCVALYRWFLHMDTRDLAPLMTAVSLLVLLPIPDFLRVPLILACAIGIAFRPLLRSPIYWFGMAIIMGWTLRTTWPTADNHRYLIFYWTVALTCVYSLPANLQTRALAFNGQIMIGLCMLLATIWKAISTTYPDCTFFHYTLLLDERFQYFSSWMSGMSLETLADNRLLRKLVTVGHLRGMEVNAVQLVDSARVDGLALFMTWWTILIEGLLALLFLLPNRGKLPFIRHTALLIFAISTYSVAHVTGFGWILMLLGIVQCTASEKHFRFGYIAVFVLIEAYVMRWEGVIEGFRFNFLA